MGLWSNIVSTAKKINDTSRNNGSSGRTTGTAIGTVAGALTGNPTVGTMLGAGLGTLYDTVNNSSGNLSGNDKEDTLQPVTEQPIQPDTTMQDYIDQMKEAQLDTTLAGLESAKNNALSNLDSESASIAPTYYNKRNQAAAASDVGAMNFSQFMAARGIKGAAVAMPEIYRNNALQGQIGALDQQEAAANTDIERRKSDVENNYESDVAGARSGAEATALQAYIDQMNADRAYKLQEAQLTGNLNGTTTLAKSQQDASNTGYYNPYASYAITDNISEQLAPYMDNLQAFINANPDSPLVPYAENLRYQKVMGSTDLKDKYGGNYQTVDARTAATQQKAQELNNIAQEIENSYLPDTLKLQAQKLKQEVDAGYLDMDIAKAQLNQIYAQKSSYTAPVTRKATSTNTQTVSQPTTNYTQTNSQTGDGSGSLAPYKATMTLLPTSGKITYLENLQKDGVSENVIKGLADYFGITI